MSTSHTLLVTSSHGGTASKSSIDKRHLAKAKAKTKTTNHAITPADNNQPNWHEESK